MPLDQSHYDMWHLNIFYRLFLSMLLRKNLFWGAFHMFYLLLESKEVTTWELVSKMCCLMAGLMGWFWPSNLVLQGVPNRESGGGLTSNPNMVGVPKIGPKDKFSTSKSFSKALGPNGVQNLQIWSGNYEMESGGSWHPSQLVPWAGSWHPKLDHWYKSRVEISYHWFKVKFFGHENQLARHP